MMFEGLTDLVLLIVMITTVTAIATIAYKYFTGDL